MKTELALFDLSNDLGQKTDVSRENADVTSKLKDLGETFEKNLKANKRPPGSL